MNAQENAKKLLDAMGTVFLVTMRDDGTPDARAMSAVHVEGFKTIYMITGAQATKTEELQKKPACMIYATALQDDAEYAELRLWGRVDVLSDRALLDEVWQDCYVDYFPKGKDDPNVRVLKFTTEQGLLGSLEGSVALTL